MNNKKWEKMAKEKIQDEGLVVSNSRLNCWRSCHRKHYYKYVLRLTPKVKGSALIRGSALHECLEYYYSGRSWKKPYKEFKAQFEKMYLKEEREVLGDLPQMVYDLMTGYVECWEREDEGMDFIEQEFEFKIPLVDDILICGFIDFIARDDRGIILGETKTHKRFPDYDVRLYNIQSSIYAWVIKQMGKYPNEDVSRIMWNYIKAKQPSRPKLLKSGTLSKAKLDSIPNVVYDEIVRLGLDPKNYQDLISAQSYNNYYRRDVLRIDNRVTKSIIVDTKATAKQIYKHPTWKDRNINKMNCQYCDYCSLCQAELSNPDMDLDFIIKKDFDQDVKRGDNKKAKCKKDKFKGRK